MVLILIFSLRDSENQQLWPTDTPGRFNLHLSNSVHEICSAHWTPLIPQARIPSFPENTSERNLNYELQFAHKCKQHQWDSALREILFVLQKKICQREAIFSANDFLHPPKFLQALRNFKDLEAVKILSGEKILCALTSIRHWVIKYRNIIPPF